MNRQSKRLMAKQQKEKERPSASRKPAPQSKDKKKKRTSTREFLRQVRQELKKVQWPTRKELISYTIVVFVSVVVLTSYVFVLDYVFSKAVIKIFGN